MEENIERESVQKIFGRNVRKYRKLAGLTQEELSEKIGVSQKRLSVIETGTQFASASLIDNLCNVLKISPADLFGGSSDEVLQEINKSHSMIMTVLLNEFNRQRALVSNLTMDVAELKSKLS